MYIYIYQICCWYCVAPFIPCPWWPAEQLSRGRGVAAPGHLGSIGQEHKLAVATLAVPQCCARAQKALNFSNAVVEAAAPPVPLHILVHFVFTLLRDASLFTKKWFIAAGLGLRRENRRGSLVCEQNSELKRRWVFQKALTLLDENRPVQRILVTVLSARLRC